MTSSPLSRLAVASVVVLITTLAYPSQYFLLSVHWTRTQSLVFNAAVACIWITYARTIFTNPGNPPATWTPAVGGPADAEAGHARGENRRLVAASTRWCKRCERFKPARSHHCKTCQKCVLKMDHHCPWTASCIGYRNLPHFLRFLVFTTTTCSWLLLQLLFRVYAVWTARALPAYHAPHSVPQLVLLVVLLALDGPLTLGLALLLIRTLLSAGEGYTTIETWEADRHHARVRRGAERRQVFPYDVGIWENMVAAFGYQFNALLWMNPLARSPVVGERKMVSGVQGGVLAGLEWEVNGFEDPDVEWPPRDGDKEAREFEAMKRSGAFTIREDEVGDVGAFRRRQTADLKRWKKGGGSGAGEADWLENDGSEQEDEVEDREEEWRNEDGERLRDYGVDEELEEEDEDVPLALLMQRRREGGESVSKVLQPISTNIIL